MPYLLQVTRVDINATLDSVCVISRSGSLLWRESFTIHKQGLELTNQNHYQGDFGIQTTIIGYWHFQGAQLCIENCGVSDDCSTLIPSISTSNTSKHRHRSPGTMLYQMFQLTGESHPRWWYTTVFAIEYSIYSTECAYVP